MNNRYQAGYRENDYPQLDELSTNLYTPVYTSNTGVVPL